ncbi:MAG: hypothetical protein K8S99_00235 [Planctomycetes bacterium]|nr:hypothetical protein [Planctomycetota bacterium]
MSQTPPSPGSTIPPEELAGRTLLTLRIVWFALLTGPLVFLGVVVMIISNGRPPQQGMEIMTFVAAGMLFTMVPTGYFVRMQFYKRFWRGDAVDPTGYFTGNLLLFALCEAVAFFGLVATLAQREWRWPAVIAGAAMLVQLVNFPTGAPMRPANPYQQTR